MPRGAMVRSDDVGAAFRLCCHPPRAYRFRIQVCCVSGCGRAHTNVCPIVGGPSNSFLPPLIRTPCLWLLLFALLIRGPSYSRGQGHLIISRYTEQPRLVAWLYNAICLYSRNNCFEALKSSNQIFLLRFWLAISTIAEYSFCLGCVCESKPIMCTLQLELPPSIQVR